jgi:hypothetical protein
MQMKSVGEAMAIDRTFQESLQKCLRSLVNPNGIQSISPGLAAQAGPARSAYPRKPSPQIHQR